MWYSGRISKDENQMEEESDQYISTRHDLEKELKNIDVGKAEFISIEQLDDDIETILKSHET